MEIKTLVKGEVKLGPGDMVGKRKGNPKGPTYVMNSEERKVYETLTNIIGDTVVVRAAREIPPEKIDWKNYDPKKISE